MALTTSTSIANWMIDAVYSQLVLQPLRGKFVILDKLNSSDISGRNTKVRKIMGMNAITKAVSDTEGTAFTTAQTISPKANISLTPTARVQRVDLTADAIELALPVGMRRRDVIDAINSGNPQMLPLVSLAVKEVLLSHYLLAEEEALALFSGASNSASSSGANPTAAACSMATLLEALFKVLNGNPEHENLAYILDEVAMKDLRAEVASGAGAALASIFVGNANANVGYFNHNPDASRIGLRGFFADMPIYAANNAIMATANSGNADRVSALIALGSGETATDGSQRGFAEFCERYEPDVGISYDIEDDKLSIIGRWCWTVGEHTDEHICKIIYDKT